ncbi:type I-E CRISPR-associated protein Cse1/CasA, partial [candidate division KSB3 bacterium]|nr:type I-E CRISPR-associated protein Cse1/CasA [candidate division KSB3 bacterium]MBD3325001.1 type I-E CRISPR-associated protein Cse1/CasA [candidate division KSB3 bacterium]
MSDFNLIDEPWIPCIDLNGRGDEYGIRDTLLKAHKLREICDDSPLVTVAIHRLLLAILYRAFMGPNDMAGWKQLFNVRSFQGNNEIDNYLTKWKNRFFLFDDQYPFMQVAGLDLNEYQPNGKLKKDKTDGLMVLVREAPDKRGRILFDHRVGTERPEYESKQIARMILSAQSYSGTGVASSGRITQNGNDRVINPTQRRTAPCVKGLVLWLQGENLFQTLLLNLIPRNYVANDKPSWEDGSIIEVAIRSWKKPRSFAGTAQRFAPLSRFIRIIDRKQMFFTNGLKTIPDSDDPMKAYSRPDDKSEYEVLKLREDRAAWRDAYALFSLGSSVRKPPEALNHLARLDSQVSHPKANIVGIATDKNKIFLWRHERMPVPAEILINVNLIERLGGLISEAEAVGSELSWGLHWDAKKKKTIRKEPIGRIQMIADLMLDPLLEFRGNGAVRTAEGRSPSDAHNASCRSLSENLDPRPAY